jgi:transcriptional regulator with XRE-family HTH domain
LQRRLRGWSQEDVAAGLYRVASAMGDADLGVDATMVSRWERGMRHPRPRYVRLLCQLFDLPAEQLGLVRDPELALVPLLPADRLQGDEADRRDFLQRLATLLGLAAVNPSLGPSSTGFEPLQPESWERLDRALGRPGRMDAETVDHLERVTHALESLEPTAIPARALLGPATGHLDAIAMLLQSSLPTDLRTRLCSLAGETAGLVGWLRWNLDDAGGASSYFRTGLRAAREADDRALGAYLAGSAACRLPGTEDAQTTLELLNGGTSGFARDDATPATRAWLAAKEADAWARLGREHECLRALEAAETIVQRLGPDDLDRRPRFTMVDRNWLAGERGATLAKLGQLADAQAILQHVVASMGPTSEQDRLWLLTALAGTHIELGEPEEACRLAQTALVGAARIHLAPIVHLVRSLRERLDRHRRNLAVQELDEQLREFGPGALQALAVT